MAGPAYHEEFAGQIIAALEQGIAPWQKPWNPGKYSAPFNPVSGTTYSGINRVRLTMEGHADPRFMTLKQANTEGWRVRKGEKSRRVVYWQFTRELPVLDDKGKPVLDAEGKETKATHLLERPILRFASVFHASQIDGIPPWQPQEQTWDAHGKAEAILSNSGASITHDQRDRAFYRRTTDAIHLPPKEAFPSADRYYATALHELGHWTGAPDRMNREFGPFGSEAYAREELRAEIASWMTGVEVGVGHDPGQHASYVDSWLKVLKEDPYEIFRACRDAEQIKQYVMGFELSQAQEVAPMQEQRSAAAAEQEAALPGAVAQEKTFLQVPFREKEQAKKAGARWDSKEKRWFAPSGSDLTAFQQWMPTAAIDEPRFPALSPEAEFADFLRNMGLDLQGELPVMDGAMHRVPLLDKTHGKDGAYRGNLDGHPAGWAQNHVTGDTSNWKATGHRLSPEQIQQMKIEAAGKRVQREAERLAAHERAAKRAYGIWANAPAWAPDSQPYLQAKGVKGYGVKVAADGNLLVPGRDVEGKIQTLQVISPDGKRFLADSRKIGTMHTIDPDKRLGTLPLLVAEGYATAASVYEATGLPVVVAFDTSNLLHVASDLTHKYPNQPLVMLADDDHGQRSNPGLTRAQSVAGQFNGTVLVPPFTEAEKGRGLTDWNDFAASRGLAAVGDEVEPAVRKIIKQRTAVSHAAGREV